MTTALIFKQFVLPFLLSGLSSVLGACGLAATRWVATKTKNEKATAFMQQLTSLVAGAVQQVETQYRPRMPALSFDGDGRLTPEGQNAARQAARRLIMNQLPRAGLKDVRHLIPDVDAFIDNQIDRFIAEGKR